MRLEVGATTSYDKFNNLFQFQTGAIRSAGNDGTIVGPKKVSIPNWFD